MPSKVQDKHKEHINAQIEKKPYEKPAIVYRAPLEAMAAFCGNPPTGKTSTANGCPSGNTFS